MQDEVTKQLILMTLVFSLVLGAGWFLRYKLLAGSKKRDKKVN